MAWVSLVASSWAETGIGAVIPIVLAWAKPGTPGLEAEGVVLASGSDGIPDIHLNDSAPEVGVSIAGSAVNSDGEPTEG
jgi:hypothetical protein